MSPEAVDALKRRLSQAIIESLRELAPDTLVSQAFSRTAAPSFSGVLAVGKASVAMCEGALDAIAASGKPAPEALCIAPYGDDGAGRLKLGHPELALHLCGHPVPDEASILAGSAALDMAARMRGHASWLVLLSGGASSLMAALPGTISLDDKQTLVRRLLASGCSIEEMNAVRRALSPVKGGRLAAASAPCRTTTWALSDVVGGNIADIGSGPTVDNPTSLEDALAIATNRAGLSAEARRRWQAAAPPLAGTCTGEWSVLASPTHLAEQVAERLGPTFRASVEPSAPVEALARVRIEQARQLCAGAGIVIACEPTVVLPARSGRGGRAGRLALLAMRGLPEDVVFASIATDGIDGAGGSAGAVVSRGDAAGHDDAIDSALGTFDDAPLHEKLGTCVKLGRGHNLTDIHVLARLS